VSGRPQAVSSQPPRPGMPGRPRRLRMKLCRRGPVARLAAGTLQRGTYAGQAKDGCWRSPGTAQVTAHGQRSGPGRRTRQAPARILDYPSCQPPACLPTRCRFAPVATRSSSPAPAESYPAHGENGADPRNRRPIARSVKPICRPARWNGTRQVRPGGQASHDLARLRRSMHPQRTVRETCVVRVMTQRRPVCVRSDGDQR
jgi:hypothetical protein